MKRVDYLCNGCNKPHPQLSVHYLPDEQRIQYLCGPCWREADYWESIRPWWRDGRLEREPAA